MNILLVNDDGIQSPGLLALAKGLSREHAVTVTAPADNCSAIGHGVTLRTPLSAHPVDFPHGVPAWSVSGTPADCTRLGLLNFAPGPVDLVISGPNRGCNLANDLHYSGTVAAALEAAMMGVKAIALSAPMDADDQQTVETFLSLFDVLDLESDFDQVLNINIPALPLQAVKGISWTPLGVQLWQGKYEQRPSIEPGMEGQGLYYPPSTPPEHEPGADNDYDRLYDGYITLTPLGYSLQQPLEGRRTIPWKSARSGVESRGVVCPWQGVEQRPTTFDEHTAGKEPPCS